MFKVKFFTQLAIDAIEAYYRYMKNQDMSHTGPGLRPNQQEVVDFLDTISLGVVSSLDNTGQPQSATVAFSQTTELELIIGTSETSRKSINLQSDPRVAFTATDPDKRYTVQFEGAAKRLSNEEFEAHAENHFRKLPASAPFRDVKGQCYFLLRPTWVRFTDCNPYPWVATEFIFD